MKADPAPTVPSPDEALQRLIDGNERFLRGEARPLDIRPETLARLARSQRPFATILGCSDSRVPPEVIFNAGLGELFVVRIAGNLFSPRVAGSLHYAGRHLHTPLFVVLGHEGCGAVSAALDTKDRGVRQPSRIQLLVETILPGLPSSDPGLSPEDRLSKAVESHVRWTVNQISESPEGQARRSDGRKRVVGAIYDIKTGRVRFLT